MKNRAVKLFTVFCPSECNADFLVCFRLFFHVWKANIQCALQCFLLRTHKIPPNGSPVTYSGVAMAPLCCQVTLLAYLFPAPSGTRAANTRGA